jgi:hypothetical protein
VDTDASVTYENVLHPGQQAVDMSVLEKDRLSKNIIKYERNQKKFANDEELAIFTDLIYSLIMYNPE